MRVFVKQDCQNFANKLYIYIKYNFYRIDFNLL